MLGYKDLYGVVDREGLFIIHNFMVFVCDNTFNTKVRALVDCFNVVARNSDPVAERIERLKQIVDSLCGIATETINHSRSNPGLVSQAIEHTHFIMDVLGDDSYSLAPDLIRQGLLDPLPDGVDSMWRDLGPYINSQLDALRLSLGPLFERESEMVISAQYTTPRPQHLKH